MDTIDWDYMLENFNGFEYDDDDAQDNYNEMIHEVIDDYVLHFDYDNKELVDKYGVFDAIALYNDNFGGWQISDSKSKNYAVLAYMIIYDEFMEKYDFETMKEKENDKLSDSDTELIEEKLKKLSVHFN